MMAFIVTCIDLFFCYEFDLILYAIWLRSDYLTYVFATMGLFDGHYGELSLLSLYCTNAILVGFHSITINIRLQVMASASTMPVTRGIEVWS